MIIAALDFGTAAICNTDYLEVYSAVLNGGTTTSRRLITRYCGNVSTCLFKSLSRPDWEVADNNLMVKKNCKSLFDQAMRCS